MDFDFKQFYLTAGGRITRKQWWLRLILPIFVITLLLVVVDEVLGTYNPQEGVGLLSGLFSLAVVIPSVLVDIKRWHDRDKSGWWMLIVLVPIVGGIWALVELGFLRGTPGPNRFGLPPSDVLPDAALTARS